MACPKPIVCAIDGPAIGMGAEFTSMCDVRIATPRARFGWVFVHRGLVPDTGAGTWILPRLIGVQATARLLFSGEIMSAEDMAGMGYVAAIVEPDELRGRGARRGRPLRDRVAVRHRARPRRCSTPASVARSTTTSGTTARSWSAASAPRTTRRASPRFLERRAPELHRPLTDPAPHPRI